MKGDYVSPSRRISLAFGALYLITIIASVPALILFQPVLDDPRATSPEPVPTTASTSGRSSS
jgi:hypothetical protein